MRIAIAGAGYVGLSLAALLAHRNDVTLVDIDAEVVNAINSGAVPTGDAELDAFLSERGVVLHATLDLAAYAGADMVIVAVPTNFDDRTGALDVSQVERVVELACEANTSAIIVVKSTLPIGFTDVLSRRYPSRCLLYSPEFLREGQFMHDCLNPSRILVGMPGAFDGGDSELHARAFARLLAEGAEAGGGAKASEILILLTSSAEAEATKLFSNAYLAMRVAFFNELDILCEMKGLDVRSVMQGVCLDERIGDYYNNPSFGFGGVCLPKDVRQLAASFEGDAHPLIDAIGLANEARKDFVANSVLARIRKAERNGISNPVVGVFGLAMKSGVGDSRSSSVLDVMERLRSEGVDLIVYEPAFEDGELQGARVVNDIEHFKCASTVILANRWSDELSDVSEKVYTRDLFGRD